MQLKYKMLAFCVAINWET